MGEAVVMEAAPTFEEYVAMRGPALWRSAWLLTRDALRAEDLVQTALVKCWHRWDEIAADGSVDGCVGRALVTNHTDWRRRKVDGRGAYRRPNCSASITTRRLGLGLVLSAHKDAMASATFLGRR